MIGADIIAAIRDHTRVKAVYAIGPGVFARGRVIGYYNEPVAIIETDDGSQVAWAATLIEEDQ